MVRRLRSSHDLKPPDRLAVHELSAVNGHCLRFEYRATITQALGGESDMHGPDLESLSFLDQTGGLPKMRLPHQESRSHRMLALEV